MVIESLTNLAEKATKAVEDIADKIDDEISNAMDKPVEPLPLGRFQKTIHLFIKIQNSNCCLEFRAVLFLARLSVASQNRQ